MMKSEFENLAGYEVSFDDYNNIIEPMYMASNLSKTEFVETINKKRFALKSQKQLEKNMKEIAKYLHETFTRFTDYEAQNQLNKIAAEYTKRFFGIGYGFYISETMEQSCFYPVKIEFYNTVSGKTVKEILFN